MSEQLSTDTLNSYNPAELQKLAGDVKQIAHQKIQQSYILARGNVRGEDTLVLFTSVNSYVESYIDDKLGLPTRLPIEKIHEQVVGELSHRGIGEHVIRHFLDTGEGFANDAIKRVMGVSLS